MSDELLYETDGALGILTLNRPKQGNAFSASLRAAMRERIAAIEADEAVRVVIVRGEGRNFCAGADLADGGGPEKPVNEHLDREYKPFLTQMAEGSTIYIAQVQGSAAGIGAAFAMNCDLVVMSDAANVYMAFAAIALIPDGGNTWLLLSQMGYHRALQAVIEGEKISAEDCLRYGIANKVVPADELRSATREWAESLAARAPLALGAAKRLLRRVGHGTYAQAISAEGLEQNVLIESRDFEEGVAAFFGKRAPSFEGR